MTTDSPYFNISSQFSDEPFSPDQKNMGKLSLSVSSIDTQDRSPCIENVYQPPQLDFSLSKISERKILEACDVFIGSCEFKYNEVVEAKAVESDNQRLYELDLLDDKLGRGHIIYFLTVLTVLIVMTVSFLFNVDIPVPVPLEVYRIILIGFLVYIMISSLLALRLKKYYLQSMVVYYIKFYTGLFVVYCVLKLIVIHTNLTPKIAVGHVLEFGTLMGVLWSSIRVRDELKRREELFVETSFNKFFI